MGELIRYLIDKLKSRPATAEALLIAAILTAAFSVAQYFETKPEAIASLSNCYFQATVIIVLSIWAASLCWRYAKVQTLRIIATLTFLGIGMLGAVAVIQASHIKPLKVRILFDESVNMPPATMAKLVSLLRSELFRIEISD
ncbi:MAG: hypothetical protein Q8M92_11170, partial [Candidatus Subteraquimicrobiales bacterium]|nr:hypothetical protein [Candidatus Subteraquimicrobiales bacterium]